MSDRIYYKDFVIIAIPWKLADDKGWTVRIKIERHTGAKVNFTPYDAEKVFATRDEAVRHCYEFGRRIIDGEQPGLNPPGLEK